jgi:S-adenosylmethionine:tRNA ribosyltransferase-isomerase
MIEKIKEGDVIVGNNSKVIGSTLMGKKETGGEIECLFLREINSQNSMWECLLKGRKLKPGGNLSFLDGQLSGIIIQWKQAGEFLVKFTSDKPVKEILRANARIKLPPYIKAPQVDITRYQTIYASEEGSIAAPTAGFHFTPELLQKIERKGVTFLTITLHVGYSTFMPVTDEILSSHKTTEPEYFLIEESLIEVLENCLAENHQLIAVGTTTLKALESATNSNGKINRLNGWSDLFIAPGYSFKSGVSRMITNFHMPKSFPLLMVCAFAGRERILHAYQEAVSQDYRFYSFGDAMFIDKE